MQSGVRRTLYDGPVSAGQLRRLKPHANCYGKGCCKIVLHEAEDEEWHISRGKPYCGDCFKIREAKRAARKAKVEAREAVAASAVEELSGGLITDKSGMDGFWRSSPENDWPT